jgi:hypothetical protein
VTTTDGHSNAIVWVLGAEGDNQLHGFRGDTGETLFTGPPQAMIGLRHFQTLIATEDRLYVAADERSYAFRFGLQRDRGIAPTEADIRMMAFRFREFTNFLDKGKRLPKIAKPEAPLDAVSSL